MVCESTLENCRLFTNYSLVRVRIKFGWPVWKPFLGCVKPERMAWVEFELVVQSYFHLLSRYWCVCSVTFSGATVLKVLEKNKNFHFFVLSHFTVLNKPQKLTDHEGENLVSDRNCVPKGMIASPTQVYHSKPFWLGTIQIFQTQVRLWGRECTAQSTRKQVFLSERVNQARLSGNDGKSLYSW